MAEKMKSSITCDIFGVCHKCLGMKKLILGVLILLNAYLAWVNWAVFVGGIIALAGLLKMLWPNCPHCK